MLRGLSLTTRLTLFYALVSAIVLLGMGGFVSEAIDSHFVELDRYVLQDKIHLIQEIAARATSSADLGARLESGLESRNSDSFYLLVSNFAGVTVYASPGFRFPESLRAISGDSPQDMITWRAGEREYRAVGATLDLSSGARERLRILAVLDTRHHAHFIASLHKTIWLYVILAALLSGVLGWWAARSGLSPLRAMRARAQAVTAYKLDERMPVEAVPVEMADLAASLNDMLQRLQYDFQRLSEFSSDLAHELRTPITNLLTQTEVVLAQRRDEGAYRDILASNAEEFQRLARMVSDMLFLAKTEHGLFLPNRDRISLADETRALFDFYEAMADEKNISLQLQGDGHIDGDRLMLRRAVGNLLSNALRYAPPGSRVTVKIVESKRGSAENVSLSVGNTGPEIESEMLSRLFDRFFRADKSRVHPDADGAGLGLPITRAIVEAHGGSVYVASSVDETWFTLIFPKGK